MLLYIVETTDELLIGMLEGIVGVQMVESCCVDDAEKEITQFLRGFLFVLFSQFSFEFSEFLSDFRPYIATVFPVEPHVSGFILNTICLDKTWQCLWRT